MHEGQLHEGQLHEGQLRKGQLHEEKMPSKNFYRLLDKASHLTAFFT